MNDIIEEKSGLAKFNDNLQRVLGKVASNRILCAMRDAFSVAAIPSFALMIPVIAGTLFFNNETMLGTIDGIHNSKGMLWISFHIYNWILSIQQISSGGYSLLLLIGLSIFMMNSYSKDSKSLITGVVLTIACFFALAPFGYTWNGALNSTNGDDLGWLKDSTPFSVIGITYLGIYGIIVALIVGITAPLCFISIKKVKALRIKMPSSVPSAISDVISNIFVITIIICAYSFVAACWAWIATAAKIKSSDGYIEDTLFIFINNLLSGALKNAAESIWVTAIVTFFIMVFWLIGMHGFSMMGPILAIILVPALTTNYYFWAYYTQPGIQQALQALAQLPKSMGTSPSKAYLDFSGWCKDHGITNAMIAYLPDPLPSLLDADHGIVIAALGGPVNGLVKAQNLGVVSLGGSGLTIGLPFAIILFGGYQPMKQVAVIEAVPAVFGINEPLMFGLPLAFNFGFAIPLIIVTTVISTICHWFVIKGWVRPTVVSVSGFAPIILRDYLATGLDWRHAVLDAGLTFLSFGYWILFIKMGTISSVKRAAADEGQTVEEYKEQNKELFIKPLIFRMFKKKTDQDLDKVDKVDE